MEAEPPALMKTIKLTVDYQLLERAGELNDPMLFEKGRTKGVVHLPSGMTAVPFGAISRNLKYEAVDLRECVPEAEWLWKKHDDYKAGIKEGWYGFRVTDRARKTWVLTGQEIRLEAEAEPPAKPLKHWTKVAPFLGYAVFPCHLCEEPKIIIDPVGDSVRCEGCGKAWGTMREYHAERETWKDYDTPPEQMREAREVEPADNTSYPSHLECFRCGGNVLHRTVLGKAEHAAYRCYQCEAEWPTLAQMYTELVEKWRSANGRLNDIRELAKNILVY
jgi:hypothetical protein